MASFELAYEAMIKNQGMFPFFNRDTKHLGAQLLCSECFNDEGLKIDAYQIGIVNTDTCTNCGSNSGYKLTKDLIRELCYRYFVRGTIEKFEYGGVSLIQMNEERINDSDIQVSPWLVNDTKLIEKHGEIGLFYYAPRFWMLGEIEPLKSMQNDAEIETVVKKILDHYPTYILSDKHTFYRIRTNPTAPHEFSQYDSPPEGQSGKNRFDANGAAVLYASPDLELCLHECRVSVEDNTFVAKLVPNQPLKVINLAHQLDEQNVNEFTSLDLAVHFLFLAGKHSYPICGRIARIIREKGFDGIIYPSYFSHVRTGGIPFHTVRGVSVRMLTRPNDSVPNLALFGRPIAENKVAVHSIDKVVINSVKYETSFGPAFHDSKVTKADTAEYLNMRREEYNAGMKEVLQSKTKKPSQ